MDPKVYGKLLTLHRRGNGVDVEALRDLMGTEGCGGGKVVLWLPWKF